MPVLLQAQEVSGLNKRDFARYWRVESEAADYKLSFLGDTLDLVAPKGLTLWRKQKMSGPLTIEYDACVVVEDSAEPTDRLSDLNCFWMASDPVCPDNIFQRSEWRNGVFLNCYTLQTYYLGFGGNYNTTTRFRRYDGDSRAVEDASHRPAVLQEYTDDDHLLKPNHWYHVKIENDGNRVSYFIDGERIVDFRDAQPYTEGWFGFRTTLSHTRITGFRCVSLRKPEAHAPLAWVGQVPQANKAVCLGVPFDEGEVTDVSQCAVTTQGHGTLPTDCWPLAYWPDGSVKWLGAAAVIPAGETQMSVVRAMRQRSNPKSLRANGISRALNVSQNENSIIVESDSLTAFIPRHGQLLIDSLVCQGITVARGLRLVAETQNHPSAEGQSELHFSKFSSVVNSTTVERKGRVSCVVRIDGFHTDGQRQWLPFTVRLYFFQNSRDVRILHTFTFDGDEHRDFIRALGVRFDVPLRDELYNRHVAFACDGNGVWSEPVQPLDGRRELRLEQSRQHQPRPDESLPDSRPQGQLSLQQQQMRAMRIPSVEMFDEQNQQLLKEWASWDGYRLSQLSSDGFTIRKQACADTPWIGTTGGQRSSGAAFVGDLTAGAMVAMKDFWQSCPSAIEVSGCKSNMATLTAWLWSPDAEPMDLRHYDKVGHGLLSAYEDIQEGMSTPYGIARTSELMLRISSGYAGKTVFANDVNNLTAISQLLPTPEYLHRKQAFGVWSLPDRSTAHRERVEDILDSYIDYYQRQTEQHRWYGFWNYGDVMHAYDAERHEWRYDVGGFAWDNTELASNMWLWYMFLRTGRADIWRMAEAMTRHTSEVDVYHIGPNAMLGTRHNVSHWGCGAKEARISQAAWNRFYYYLTADERCGDLMTAVRDADQMLYTLDPMRLAQPRGEYPCTAPARLRIGPDWLAYAGNWMTEWERTRNNHYRDKIVTGMKSIAALPHRMFTGPLALGYDPATGIITTECDTSLLSTNHLMTIMGGFEVMNEMMRMIHVPQWENAWLKHAALDKQMALRVRNNRFRISRLLAYAAYHNRDSEMANEAWDDLMRAAGSTDDPRYQRLVILPPEVPAPQDEVLMMSTNGVATWSLDAIYMQEVIPK